MWPAGLGLGQVVPASAEMEADWQDSRGWLFKQRHSSGEPVL